VSTIDVLRGLAALAVCWYHFTQGNPGFLPPGPLKASGVRGWLGVEVFFVISGFVIPYALYRARYRLGDYGRFVLKRIIRLDPPYFFSIVVVLAAGYVSARLPGYGGEPFAVNWVQLALHLGYVNVFFGYRWLSPVFWTLALELQYYLLIGLLFPLLLTRSRVVRVAAFSTAAALAWAVPADAFVFHWLFLFLAGIVVFQHRAGLLAGPGLFAGLAVSSVGVAMTHGAMVAAVVLTTALVLSFVTLPATGVLGFLGRVSYSLYLVHVPIGGRVINLGARYELSAVGQVAVLAAALATTLLSAYLMYVLVERPAQRWSAAIRYRSRPA
jgi:peptidoglycan/LPS O-acetylase OafA/YrhL